MVIVDGMHRLEVETEGEEEESFRNMRNGRWCGAAAKGQSQWMKMKARELPHKRRGEQRAMKMVVVQGMQKQSEEEEGERGRGYQRAYWRFWEDLQGG